ncbi:FUSC family protein [Corynebacterium massiliense]|uniref:FUSC family protein n=1 Tax=Corynebacterium massiliense TaxID=441501 RepID=UPI0023573DD2|nr:FUSC family protein [Corynebacterium massiliense]
MSSRTTSPSQRGLSTRERLQVIDRSLIARAQRVRHRLVYILQATIAAGIAFWVAHRVVGHPQPFFAPISAVIIMGLSGGNRLSRALEMSIGVTFSVAVGDTLVQLIGTGPIQMTIIIGLALIIGSFLSKSPLIINQIVIGSILIATILPPGSEVGGGARAIDALLGSGIGILTMAIIPASPLREGRNEISNVLSIVSSGLSDTKKALEERDGELIAAARDAVNAVDNPLNRLMTAAKSGRETTDVSPLMWGSRRQVRSLERTLEPVDNLVRGSRVLSRRALVLIEDDDDITDEMLDQIDELAEITLDLAQVYKRKTPISEAKEIPAAVQRLRYLGARAGMGALGDAPVLCDYAILSQIRAIIVDLLMICGMSRESASAMLIPTSKTPAFPPEVWSDVWPTGDAPDSDAGPDSDADASPASADSSADSESSR